MEINPRLAKDRVLNIFEMWLDDYPLNELPWQVQTDMVEIPFQIPLTDNIVYCGIIDQLGTMKGTGNWVVIDIKTTRQINKRWLKKFWMDTQVSGYIYAAQQHVSQVMGMLIGVIEIPEVKVSSAKCKLHGVPYTECDIAHAKFEWVGPITRTKEQLKSWKATAIQEAEKYRKLHALTKAVKFVDNKPIPIGLETIDQIPQEGMFTEVEYTNACVACECFNFCNDSRPTHMIDNYFKHDPWFCFKELLDA